MSLNPFLFNKRSLLHVINLNSLSFFSQADLCRRAEEKTLNISNTSNELKVRSAIFFLGCVSVCVCEIKRPVNWLRHISPTCLFSILFNWLALFQKATESDGWKHTESVISNSFIHSPVLLCFFLSLYYYICLCLSPLSFFLLPKDNFLSLPLSLSLMIFVLHG